MNLKLYITVHVYAEEQLCDKILQPYSRSYGLSGKEIIAPLRAINKKKISIKRVPENFSVKELWNWLYAKLYSNTSLPGIDDTLNFIKACHVIKNYMVFNRLRYTVEDVEKPLVYYLHRMNASEDEVVNIELLVCEDAGCIFKDDGIRYYIHSKEHGRHNVPHVHVDIRNTTSGSFSLLDGTQLSGRGIKPSEAKKIKRVISEQREKLLQYWNEHTDGLTVDLNQALGLIQY